MKKLSKKTTKKKVVTKKKVTVKKKVAKKRVTKKEVGSEIPPVDISTYTMVPSNLITGDRSQYIIVKTDMHQLQEMLGALIDKQGAVAIGVLCKKM